MARSITRVVLLLALTCLGVQAQDKISDHCSGGTPFPFSSIEASHPIDQSCGVEGNAASKNSQLQNSVKNNFCSAAPSGKPEVYTPEMLISLEKTKSIPSGQGKEPSSRTQLQHWGEGKVVIMKAYLIEAHHADLPTSSEIAAGKKGGETVNCNGNTPDENDVHIALGAHASTKECDSVTAEISPHFRPASWDQIGQFETFDPHSGRYTPNPAVASRLQSHPYRITGQLFFDASHAPCPCGTAHCAPLRSSVWEIHPIYNIEVCRAGSSCDVGNDADWISFDTWWNALTPLQPLAAPHKHEETPE
jgi:hypothetical protein